MKRLLIYLLLLFFSYNMLSQRHKELKKIKCLEKMAVSCEEFKKQDTIYILYYESNVSGLEQNKLQIPNYKDNGYYFNSYNQFPLKIYDLDGFNKVNYKKPVEMYKTKSFICENIDKVVDVNFLKKCDFHFHADFFNKKKIIFIIDLDAKVKNKYKIIQVGKPRYIID